ncbi:unnamed protein product [Sphagnum balticum]
MPAVRAPDYRKYVQQQLILEAQEEFERAHPRRVKATSPDRVLYAHTCRPTTSRCPHFTPSILPTPSLSDNDCTTTTSCAATVTNATRCSCRSFWSSVSHRIPAATFAWPGPVVAGQ